MTLGYFIFFLAPLLAANVIHHFIVIKYNILPRLAKPIDFGKKIDGVRVFGVAKTMRGFLVVVPLAALFSYVVSIFVSVPLQHSAFIVGALTGLGYMAGELPNSFLKRQLGVKESGIATGRLKKLLSVADHTDSVAGALLFLFLIEPVTPQTIVMLFISGTTLHVFIDALLHKFSYKKNIS